MGLSKDDIVLLTKDMPEDDVLSEEDTLLLDDKNDEKQPETKEQEDVNSKNESMSTVMKHFQWTLMEVESHIVCTSNTWARGFPLLLPTTRTSKCV
jgi:hypothetical protein